jgi:NAD(P)-dependent dehydrogenase (short-subunit alcohol dehydrogenase family)
MLGGPAAKTRGADADQAKEVGTYGWGSMRPPRKTKRAKLNRTEKTPVARTGSCQDRNMEVGSSLVAVVTGATSGIGLGIARRLRHEGYRVVLNSARSVDAGQALAAEFGNSIYVQADVSDEGDCQRLIGAAVETFGRLDLLVNNAGISEVVPHADLGAATPELWRRMYDTNVIGPWMLITAAEEHLKRSPNGSIVNISSHAGVRPKGASIPYAVSKAALNHMTRLLASSLGPNIRCNAIAPGLVDTPLTQTWTAAQELWATNSPMQRAATVDDIAHLVAMLASSTYLTGEVLVVDGGLNLK